MDVHLGVQWQGVLIACLAGVGLAAVYDGLRIFRLLLSGEKGHVVLQDFFFMVFSAFITFLVCLAASYGRRDWRGGVFPHPGAGYPAHGQRDTPGVLCDLFLDPPVFVPSCFCGFARSWPWNPA